MSKLCDLLSPYKTISIIGMSKNAGKTTVLNHLIDGFSGQKFSLALTSIGRDGERTDVVTKTSKPEIFVPRGTVIATAEGLLPFCDITKEIIGLTALSTPLGRIALVRALSDGYVQLGGPSITAQLTDLIADLRADKIIVDGAISRKTLAGPDVTEATILCVGAALDRNMGKVIDQTRHAVEMLTLPKPEYEKLISELEAHIDENIVSEDKSDKKEYIYFPGAVTDATVSDLLLSKSALKGIHIIAKDPTKIFITSDTYRKLLFKKAKLTVLKPIRLVALTVNPTSPEGVGFDSQAFQAEMQEAVKVPVVNVCNLENSKLGMS